MDIRRVPIEQVEPWEKNPRGIKKVDFERLKRQIERLSVYKPLVCIEENGKYITLGGNMRIRALKELGHKEVDVSIVQAETEKQKIEYALSDNDRAGYYEEDKLTELVYPHIEEIRLEDFKVDVGEPIDLKDIVERFGPDLDEKADEIPEIDDSPVMTKTGDLFTLGNHRLMCGDSTKAEDVARLMAGKKGNAVLTDPPYGQNQPGIPNDEEAYQQQLYKAVFVLPISDAAVVAFQSPRTFSTWLNAAVNQGHKIERLLWLYKQAQESYPWRGWLLKSEAILITSKGNPAWNDIHPYHHDCYVLSEVSGQLTKGQGWHGSVKPLDVVSDILIRISRDDGIVFDGFLGSGTTLIAAEKTGRICYGMEIDPKYCDVIIKRYADYVGIDEENIRQTRENPEG